MQLDDFTIHFLRFNNGLNYSDQQLDNEVNDFFNFNVHQETVGFKI